LQATRFPDSFPTDIMHLFFEGIAPAMLRHWQGQYFRSEKKKHLNLNNVYTLSSRIWTDIGTTMAKNVKKIPRDFGRPPINISHHNAFKAEEWCNWIILYSIPLLLPYLPKQ
jgi:hypothetical protein